MRRIIRYLIGQFFSKEPKHFLILLQNNNELRSTGGYITSVFDVTLGKWKARKRSLNVGTDLVKHEKVEAPKPIQEMLFDSHLNTWTFRDANFDPDFNESAKKAIEFYHMVYPDHPVSGLLMVTYGFAENLLRLLGPVSIRGRILTYKNLFDVLSTNSYDIDRKNHDANNARKEALGALAKKLYIKASLKPWKWLSLWRLGQRAFKTRDLQFFDSENPLKSDFRPVPHQDFLAVIENNYLGLKCNRYIKRDISHDTQVFTEGDLKNTLRISWRHLGIYNYPLSGEYRGHIRIYLPAAARLKEGKGFEVSEDHGFKVVSFKIKLQPKDSYTFTFSYELPASYADNRYRFRFYKQPGTQNEDLQKTLSLPITLDFSDSVDDHHDQVLIKSYSDIAEDLEFEASFHKSKRAPRICGHEIVAKNQILVKFNEVIHPEGALIQIHEKGHPEKEIEVISTKTIVFGKWLLITVEDFPRIEEVFYLVSLKDVRNQNGVAIHPNPRTITVAYRPRYFEYWKKRL